MLYVIFSEKMDEKYLSQLCFFIELGGNDFLEGEGKGLSEGAM